MRQKQSQAENVIGGRPRRSEDARLEGLLVAVTLDRERDQPIEERAVAQAGRVPQPRKHADGREAGDRVDLVDEQLARAPVEEEIDAREPAAIDRREGG